MHLLKSFADETRLRCLLLIRQETELCVCELTVALELSQPKMSRHRVLVFYLKKDMGKLASPSSPL